MHGITIVLLAAMMGPSEQDLVAAEQFYHRDMLEHIGKRQADYEQLLARTAQAFAVKVKVGTLCLASGYRSLGGEYGGIDARKSRIWPQQRCRQFRCTFAVRATDGYIGGGAGFGKAHT